MKLCNIETCEKVFLTLSYVVALELDGIQRQITTIVEHGLQVLPKTCKTYIVFNGGLIENIEIKYPRPITLYVASNFLELKMIQTKGQNIVFKFIFGKENRYCSNFVVDYMLTH